MNGMQRLDAAITGKGADRIPIFCNLLDQGAREIGVSIRDYYARGDLVAEAQLRMRARFGYDNVWCLFYVGKEAELWGCRDIDFPGNGPPNVKQHVIEDLRGIAAIEIPNDIENHPAFAEPARCLRILRREAGGRHPICAYITSTMTLPVLLMGMERWIELLLCGPAAAREELLAKCHEFFRREVAAYRAGGADVILYANPFGSPDTLPMRRLVDLALPWIEKDVRAVGPQGLVYYCGMSRINQVLELVLKSTALGAYYLGPLDDVEEAKRILDGRALTCGVLNDIPLIDWTRDQVRDEVARIIGAGKPGGRFLFGTGVMPMAIPDETIQAVVEAACEFGGW